MAGSDERRKPQARAMPPDLDATRLGSIPPANLEPSAQPIDEYPAPPADSVAMPPAYSVPAYSDSVYPEPPQQPMVSPAPAAYSPYPIYADAATQSVPQSVPNQEKSKRRWGVIVLIVLLVLALIGLAIGATWIFTSKSGDKKDAAASQSQTESTKTATVLETTATATQAPRQAPNRVPAQTGKPIPANAVYKDGFATPSGNIACEFLDSELKCAIFARQWGSGCSSPWLMSIDAGGVHSQCLPLHEMGAPDFVGSYGTVYYYGNFACEVGEHTGVNCWDSRTGHGFTMRQADHSTY